VVELLLQILGKIGDDQPEKMIHSQVKLDRDRFTEYARPSELILAQEEQHQLKFLACRRRDSSVQLQMFAVLASLARAAHVSLSMRLKF